MTQLKLISILLTIAFTSAQMPIPLRPDGYGVGGPADAHVVVELFFDPLCPGCKAVWPTILQVIQAYGTRIHVRIHTFPLPYHTNSFVASQGLHVVANVTNRNLDTIFQYATKVLESQQIWYNDATKTMTMPQIVDSLASFVDSAGLIPKAKFADGMASDDVNHQTRVSWEYACSRGTQCEQQRTSSSFLLLICRCGRHADVFHQWRVYQY
jgi:protein-disulfide isomerase